MKSGNLPNTLPSTDKPLPRIYAACLASYMADGLSGKWIDAHTKPGEDILAQLKQLLVNSLTARCVKHLFVAITTNYIGVAAWNGLQKGYLTPQKYNNTMAGIMSQIRIKKWI